MTDELTELSKGWIRARFGDCLKLINGRAYLRHELLDKGTPIIRIQNLNGGDNWFYSNLELPEDKYCEAGDLLFAWSATFGPFIWKGSRSIYHYHIWKVETTEVVDRAFAYYLLQEITEEIKAAAHGVAMPHMTKQGMEDWLIVLPPLNEQRRIVEAIESLRAKVQRSRQALEEVSQLCDRFRQSVLAAAFQGDLTADWREQNPDVESTLVLLEKIKHQIKTGSNKNKIKDLDDSWRTKHPSELPKGWHLIQIRDVCTSSFYGPRFGKDEYVLDGIPTIRTTDMSEDGAIVLKDAPRVKVAKDRLDDFKLLKGDLLITRTGSIGMMAVFREEYLAIPSAYLIRFRFSSLILIDYIFYYLKSPSGQNLLGLGSTAVTQPNINAEVIKDLPIPITSLAEQQEIIQQITALMNGIIQIEQQYQEAKSHLDRLDRAILAKAFRGELVEQDPNDEPATVLLDRIRKERQTQPKAAKGRKKAIDKQVELFESDRSDDR